MSDLDNKRSNHLLSHKIFYSISLYLTFQHYINSISFALNHKAFGIRCNEKQISATFYQIGIGINRLSHLERLCCEFHPNGGFRLQAELVPRISRQYIGFSDSRITDQNDLEEIFLRPVETMLLRYRLLVPLNQATCKFISITRSSETNLVVSEYRRTLSTSSASNSETGSLNPIA
ncbi:hypothetical protein M5K25_011770 [Dendrobium thyrsiflorum]|uniref:Uncharacterized protein n=1 Tax=Dendrobium thyrsiflorum TaxID=117978 RepID=A0ABD0V412_DENTH